MADNYLEKQFASYEARKAAWEREKRLGKKRAHKVKAAPAEEATAESEEYDVEQPIIRNDDNLTEND